MRRLRKIRLRIALAYAATSAAMLLVLGGILFFLLVRERSAELDRSLAQATQETVRGAAIIAADQMDAARVARDAVDELETPAMPLYLFDARGRYMGHAAPPQQVYQTARAALRTASATGTFEHNHETWRMAAQAFAIRNARFAVVALADESMLDRQYLRLIELFGVAAAFGLVLIGTASYYFAGRAIQPIQANADAVRRFMADAAHELRTPVAAVRTNAEVALEQAGRNDVTSHSLEAILAESSRLSGLVADLLTLARADSGERPLKNESFYLDDIVSDTMASAAAGARAHNIALAQGRYEQARVTGDAGLIGQLLSILLDNALKYTPPGGTVSTDVFVVDGAAIVRVHDTGIGVSPEALPHVFERFYRGEQARELAPGTGLGLAIAKWIAGIHGGVITLKSVPGEGSTFEVRLPAGA